MGWSGVYLPFSRSSEYIGKANLTRQKARGPMGLSAKCLEHFRALRHPQTAEGRMGRYKHLRISIGTVAFLPILTTEEETRALAIESTLYATLAPRGNECDVAAWSARRATAALLRPHRVRKRLRPVAALRQPLVRARSIWTVEQFSTTVAMRYQAKLERQAGIRILAGLLL